MYGKIHDSIFNSSLLEGRPPDQIHTAYVFMCLNVIADAGDDVLESRDVLAAMFRVSRETLDQAILELEQPDPISRSTDQGGRRIVPLDDRREWGWHITNRDRYKRLRSAEDRREYHRQKHDERKIKQTNTSTVVNNRQQASTASTKAVGIGICKGICKGSKESTGTASRSPRAPQFVPPTLEDVRAYCAERRNAVDPQAWIDHYESNGWRVGRNPMKSWKAAVRTWEKNGLDAPTVPQEHPKPLKPGRRDPALAKAEQDRLEWEAEQARLEREVPA